MNEMAVEVTPTPGLGGRGRDETRKETAMSDERPGWHRHPNGGGWVQDTDEVVEDGDR